MVDVTKNAELINKAKELLMKAEHNVKTVDAKAAFEKAKAAIQVAKAKVELARAAAAPYLAKIKEAEAVVMSATKAADLAKAGVEKVSATADAAPKTRAPRTPKAEPEVTHEAVKKESKPAVRTVAVKPASEPAAEKPASVAAKLGVPKKSPAIVKPAAKQAIKGGASEAPTEIAGFEGGAGGSTAKAGVKSKLDGGPKNGVKSTPRADAFEPADEAGPKTAAVVAKSKGKSNPHAGVTAWWQKAGAAN